MNFALKRLIRATNVTNRAFCSAMPIDNTQVCHVLFRLRMLKLVIGKGHQLIKVQHMELVACLWL